MSKTEYDVEVVFSISIPITVRANSVEEAMDRAEFLAAQQFEKDLNNGMYGINDFDYEAQTP